MTTSVGSAGARVGMASSVSVDVDFVEVAGAGASVMETCVPASFESTGSPLYSVEGIVVERRLASVGVWTSAIFWVYVEVSGAGTSEVSK